MKILPVCIVLIVGLVIVLVVIAARKASALERKRREEIGAALAKLGLAMSAEKKAPAHAEAFALAGELKSLSRGASGVNWSARGALGGREVVVFEHSFTTSTGKSTVTHFHTIAATACPMSWPRLSLDEEGLLAKIAEFLGMRDIKLEDEAFNARWRLKCGSEDFALLVLGPEAQAWCMALPKGLCIRIGQGAVVVFAPRQVRKPEDVATLAEMPGRLMELIPAELAGFRG